MNNKNIKKTVKKSVRKFCVAATIFTLLLSSFGPIVTGWVPVAKAAATVVASSAVFNPGTPIKAGSAATAVVKISVTTNLTGKALTTVTASFSGTGFATSDLAALSTSTSSGVMLYNDIGGGNAGIFGPGDTMINISATSWSGTNVTLTPSPPVALVQNVASIFYVVIQTSSSAANGHQIIATIPLNGVATNDTSGPGAPAVSNSLVVDTIAPILDTSTSGPLNGAVGVPISTVEHISFSEAMDQSTLNPSPSNITFTAGTPGAATPGSNPVSYSTRPFPNGFDLTASNPPVFAGSSNFAKASTVATGFFNMMGTNPIFPQGNYASPANGDIVYFQHDTFPPEVGIITNNTLTSGTFGVNDFVLYGGQQITEFASSYASGPISGGASVSAGDIIVANTTANPVDVKYNWHVVTTSGVINSVAKLDGNSSLPSFVTGSSFSKITPGATATANSSNQIIGGINLAQGDLVFANITANSDNLNTYAWHVVTAAENISGGAAPSTLVLDGASGVPTFASGSQISKIASAATGLSGNGSDTTPFSYGDIVFAKTTGFASNNGAYNFHLATRSATGIASSNLRLDNATAVFSSNTTYTVNIGTGVKDMAGNAFAGTTINFTTGATGNTNTTPPFMQMSIPQSGNQSFPTGVPLKVQFSVSMSTTGGSSGANSVTNPSNVGIFKDNYGAPGTPVSGVMNTYDDSIHTVTLTPSPALSPSTSYILKIEPVTQSSTGVNLSQPFMIYFTTGVGADTTPPTVMGVYPGNNATGVQRNAGVSIGFSEDVDPTTITSGNITVVAGGPGPAAGSVSYSYSNRKAYFTPSQLMAAGAAYTVTVATGVKDLAGNSLASQYTSTFTTGSASISAATVTSANADNFGVAITFSEPMKNGGGPNAADNIANYSLESPVGSSISLGGKGVVYDGPTMTAKLNGISLQSGNTYKVTVSNLVQDISGTGISTSGTPAANVAQGTVANATMTGGQLGPGSGPAQTGAQMGMTPVNVMPMNKAAGATSNYGVQFPVTTSIPLGGSVVLTFPDGFNVANAVAATAGTESFNNSDINGPMAGTVTIASVTPNPLARTIAIVTGGADTGANAFISFDLKSIVNSTIPTSTGYTVDIKTKDASGTILETKTSNPFFLGQTGSYTLTVNVFNDNGAGGGTAGNNVKDGTEAGIQNATVFLFSPAVGGQSAVTNSSGVAAFSSLSSGDYMIGIDPKSVASGGFAFNSAPQSVTVSGSGSKNFGLQAAPYTISGTVYGPANTALDVFASGMNGFAKTTVITNSTPVTVNSVAYDGSVAYSLPVQANTTYQVGVGPAMPATMMMPGAPPPPPPTFTFMPPPNVTINITTASVSSQNFALTSANKTIAGTIKDSAGNGINSAMVFARPAENSTTGGGSIGMGTGGQTDASGNFTLKVVPGVYIVGAFKPGMPGVPDKQITVPASGSNSPASLDFVLDFNSSSALTIGGTIKDDSGNAIPYAGVSGRKVVSTSNTTPLGGGGDNFVGGPTNSNGAYTLYVTGGTWVIEAFAPGFGKLGTKTITVGTSSLSGQDFSAQTLSMGTIAGQATKASVAQQGVIVRVDGTNGGNMTVTDVSGNYTLKIPAGTYTVTCMFPGVGESTPLTGVAVTANTATSNQNCALASPITITVNLTDGTNPISNAFVDVRDSNGRGNSTNVSTSSGANAVYMVTVPPGTYTVRAGHPAYGMIGTTASVSANQSIIYTAAAGKMYAVTGSVTGGGSPLSGAWVSLDGKPTGQTNIIHLGGQTDSSGNFSVNVPNGVYSYRADKPGYKSPAAGTVTVNGATIAVGTIALTTASRTITGTVTLNSSGVSNAFVDANDGQGGFAVAQTDANGAYSLAVDNGTWAIKAHSLGYEGGPLSVTVNNNSPSGQNIALSAISGFTIKPEKQETVTPTSGGYLTNTDIGSGFKVNIPANALGTSSNASTITTQTNTAVPNPSRGTILSKSAVKISAVDSSGQPIKTLNNSVTITVPYNASDIPTGGSESSLVLGVWNGATQSYDTLSTTVDTVNDTLTATTSHFSDFAPLLAIGAAPSTPSGFSAVAASSSQIDLSWSAVSGATGYDIYRSATSGGTYSRLGSDPTVSSGSTVSYSDTGLPASTAYYYKISAINSGGESAASSAVTATTSAASSGGGSIIGNTIPTLTGSVVINNGAASTSTASVTLALGSAGATEMAVANTSDFAGTSWEAYATTKSWTLASGDGTKTVYVKFRNSLGGFSSVVSDTITLGNASSETAPSSGNASGMASIYPDGTLIKSDSAPEVYVIKEGKRVWVPNLQAFTAGGYKWSDIKTVSGDAIKQVGAATLVRVAGDPRVYAIVDNTRRHVSSAEAFNSAGYKWADVVTVSQEELGAYPEGGAVAAGGKTIVVTASSLMVRNSNSAGGKVLGSVKNGETYFVLDESGGWYKIKNSRGVTGWISGEFASAQPAAASQQGNSVAPTAKGNITITSAWVRIRDANSTRGKILGKANKGETYVLLDETNGWYKIITNNGLTGWVSAQYAVKQ